MFSLSISSSENSKLCEILSTFESKETISRLAALQTLPNLQSNAIRLSLLIHLAVANCAGAKKPKNREMRRWLNHDLNYLAGMEDPTEDVFITIIRTARGNFRIFEGNWQTNDYFCQVVVDTLLRFKASDKVESIINSVFALLKLSDAVADRLGLSRWNFQSSRPQEDISIASADRIEERARAVTFKKQDLNSLGIDWKLLEPFVLNSAHHEKILAETLGNTSLERYPLIDYEEELVLALPDSVSPAIRRYVLSELKSLNLLSKFAKDLMYLQGEQVDQILQGLKDKAISIEQPEPTSLELPPIHSWLLKYDSDKYLNVILVHDNISMIERQGLDSILNYPEELATGLEKLIVETISHCEDQRDFTLGATLMIIGGLGRGFGFGLNQETKNQWLFPGIGIADLQLLSRDTNKPVKQFLKCIKQRKYAEDKGVKYLNFSGDFNFYCYWRKEGYRLGPLDAKFGPRTMVWMQNDFVLDIRKHLRNLVDSHMIELVDGSFVHVERLDRDSYFKSMHARPIYASLDHVENGILAGAIETPRGPSWLTIISSERDLAWQNLLYQIWHGFIGLFDGVVHEAEDEIAEKPLGPIEVAIDLSEVEIPEVSEIIQEKNDPEVFINLKEKKVVIKLPKSFLHLFRQKENFGEKYMVKALSLGLIGLLQQNDSEIDQALVEKVTNEVVGDSGVRVLHLFETYRPIEYLLARPQQKLTLVPEEDVSFLRLGLSEGIEAYPKVINNKQRCNEFLNKVVEKLWLQIRDSLRQLNRNSVLRTLIEVHEGIIHDREHWEKTAQAVIAIYSQNDDVYSVSHQREIKRVQAALAARSLMEMAICECPVGDGKELTEWDLDELLALASLLFDTASDSDAIHQEFSEPRIQLHANGEYSVDRGYFETLIQPFTSNYYREIFEEAAAEYGKQYVIKEYKERKLMADLYSKDFNEAFKKEFGLTPDDVLECFAELFDFAVELDSVVIRTEFGTLKNRLLEKRHLSEEVCESFFDAFSIIHRSDWSSPPEGFSNKDIIPWRFRRRLSVVVRPLLMYGHDENDSVFFGVAALRQSMGYVFDKTEQGQLPENFFRTKEMKSYIGMVNDKRGHAFNTSVAEELGKKGWQTKPEVKMSRIGAPDNLGDVDVLAWKSSGEVLLIECKRLRLAMSVKEISEICGQFKGEVKDKLDKHIKRLAWVKENPASLKEIIGFIPEQTRIELRLVTNTHVPMRYLQGLPIESKQIGTLIQLFC